VAGTDLQFTVSALDRAATTLIRVADQLDRLSEKINKVDGKVARITAELDDARADAGLDNLERKRRELDGKKTTIKVDADKSLLDRIVDIHQLNLALDAVQLPAKALKAIAVGAELANIGSATVEHERRARRRAGHRVRRGRRTGRAQARHDWLRRRPQGISTKATSASSTPM
jgi:hypothetical protein